MRKTHKDPLSALKRNLNALCAKYSTLSKHLKVDRSMNKRMVKTHHGKKQSETVTNKTLSR